MSEQCIWGFTPLLECENCDGTGTFTEDEQGNPVEPCAFCLDEAILRGELDGQVDGVDYVKGIPVSG